MCSRFSLLHSLCRESSRCAFRSFSSRPRGKMVRDLLKVSPAAGSSGAPVTAKGWIKSIRKLKNVTFIHVDDGSSVAALQVTVSDPRLRELPLTFGSAVTVKGLLSPSPAKGQVVELVAEDIDIVQTNDPAEYPFKFKERHHVDYYRQYLHLRPRDEQFASLLRVRNSATMAIHEYFQENDFVLVHTPILTSNDCEGGGETFSLGEDVGSTDPKVKKAFFNKPVVLTVSGQLHLEAAVSGLSRVYNFNPAFRAERQQSRRHLSEFWMVEAEVAFLGDMEELLCFIEDMVKTVTEKLIERSPEDFHYHMKNIAEDGHQDKLKRMLSDKFIRLSYPEALQILLQHKDTFHEPPTPGENLHRDHELFLVRHFGDVPLFVTHFPCSVKPFYARRWDEDEKYAMAADLIVPDVGELVGSSLREHRYDVLLERCQKVGQLDKLGWYLELRKFGGPPTGGFGMGFERLLQYLLGIRSIKDAMPFPRWIDHCAM